MKSIRELKDKYAGREVAVLGGGPNLPGDVEMLSADAVLVQVNHHAGKIVDPDYVCFADDPQFNKTAAIISNMYAGKRITFIGGYSDWEIDIPYYYYGLTAPLAVWFAEYSGGKPIVLCGMDLWSTGGHFHDDKRPSRKEFARHMDIWLRVFREAKRAEDIRAASGPLIPLFGKYTNGENVFGSV